MLKSPYLASALAIMTSAALAQTAVQKPITRSAYMAETQARFRSINTSHSGAITKAELAAAEARTAQQLTAALNQKLREEFNRLDTNHDGKLSFEEFVAIAPPIRARETPDQLIEMYDRNHDGTISLDEFMAVEMAKFDKIDTNHDGVITPDELKAAQQRK